MFEHKLREIAVEYVKSIDMPINEKIEYAIYFMLCNISEIQNWSSSFE